MQLDVVYQTKQEIYAIWGPVVIRLLDGAETEPADIDRLHGLLAGVLIGWPTVGMLLISHHGSPQPSLATMRYSNKEMGDLEDRMVIAVALLGLGFWAEAARATTAWLMRMLRHGSVVLESSVEAAARGMALELVGLDADGLVKACEQLERRFREQG
jgi:hypothetical protein